MVIGFEALPASSGLALQTTKHTCSTMAIVWTITLAHACGGAANYRLLADRQLTAH